MKMQAVRVVLSTKKEVILREMEIEDEENAAAEVAAKAGDSPMLFAFLMQKALIKQLLLRVDGKALTLNDKENLKALFTKREYDEVRTVVARVSGVDGSKDLGKGLALEVVTDGE
jgi:hypothetical protein